SCLGDCVVRLDRPERFIAEREALRKFDAGLRCAFTGHTHTQGIAAIDAAGRVTLHRPQKLRFEQSSFYFINPGSVGHPREADYRARYATYDSGRDQVEFHRVRYDRPAMDRENARHGIGTDLGLPVGARYLEPVRALLGRFGGRGGPANGG
ncbi:MAG TPA: hypothetical protein VMJ30_08140, partial [Gemmatimonadales bacterium]|nr:hypothetical protein [Gemmatimonadales bacterium]